MNTKEIAKARKKLMETAEKYIGEKEVPDGSNNVIFNTHYYGKEVSGGDYPWCCAYIWDIFRLAGLSKYFYNGKKTASCETSRQYQIDKVQIVEEPQYGDLVYFNNVNKNRANHIGFFKEWVEKGKIFKCVEGNCGNAVKCIKRNVDEVISFGNPFKLAEDEEVINKIPTEVKETVKDIQKWLNKYFNAGLIVDNDYGPLTKNALCKAFQKTIGTDPDGKFGPKTLAASPLCLLKGSKGMTVTLWQMVLVCNGYKPNGIDGSFGSGCQKATKAYQKKLKVAQNGRVDRTMWKKALK